ncbi:hypothetical protein HDU98_007278 [Podochytrium sp. JEL0797]|nr:hypothetical protein HDU98_007278 [Podochytrium sp. JEL0797]
MTPSNVSVSSSTDNGSTAIEYGRARAQLAVLRKGLLLEQAKTKSLETQLRNKDQMLRDANQQMLLLSAHNETLVKRIELMTREKESSSGFASLIPSILLKKKPSTASISASLHSHQDMELVFDQMESKAIENADLRDQLESTESTLTSLRSKLFDTESSVAALTASHADLESRSQALQTQLEKSRELMGVQKQRDSVYLLNLMHCVQDWRGFALQVQELAVGGDGTEGLHKQTSAPVILYFMNVLRKYCESAFEVLGVNLQNSPFTTANPSLLDPLTSPQNLPPLRKFESALSASCLVQISSLSNVSLKRRSIVLDLAVAAIKDRESSGRNDWTASLVADLKDLAATFQDFVSCVETASSSSDPTSATSQIHIHHLFTRLQHTFHTRLATHWRFKLHTITPTRATTTLLAIFPSTTPATPVAVDADSIHALYRISDTIFTHHVSAAARVARPQCGVQTESIDVLESNTQTDALAHTVTTGSDPIRIEGVECGKGVQTDGIETAHTGTDAAESNGVAVDTQTDAVECLDRGVRSGVVRVEEMGVQTLAVDLATDAAEAKGAVGVGVDTQTVAVKCLDRGVGSGVVHVEEMGVQTLTAVGTSVSCQQADVVESVPVQTETVSTGVCGIQTLVDEVPLERGTDASTEEVFEQAHDVLDQLGVGVAESVNEDVMVVDVNGEDEDEVSGRTTNSESVSKAGPVAATSGVASVSSGEKKKKKKNKKKSGGSGGGGAANGAGGGSGTGAVVLTPQKAVSTDASLPPDTAPTAPTPAATLVPEALEPAIPPPTQPITSLLSSTLAPETQEPAILLQPTIPTPPRPEPPLSQTITITSQATLTHFSLPAASLLTYTTPQHVSIEKKGCIDAVWDMQRIQALVDTCQRNEARCVRYERLLRDKGGVMEEEEETVEC